MKESAEEVPEDGAVTRALAAVLAELGIVKQQYHSGGEPPSLSPPPEPPSVSPPRAPRPCRTFCTHTLTGGRDTARAGGSGARVGSGNVLFPHPYHVLFPHPYHGSARAGALSRFLGNG